MTSPWKISAGTDRIKLNPKREGLVTFTVTNQSPVDHRAVLEVLPGENAKPEWFTVAVEEPPTLIKQGSSASLPVRVAVRPDVAPGSFWLAGRVYSAEGAPEESSAVSDRVAFEVTGAGAAKRLNPLVWIIPIVVLALVVAGVLGWLFLGGDEPEPTAQTTTPAPPVTTTTQPPAVMVNLTGKTEQQATDILTGLGASVGTVQHKHDPPNAGKVVSQSLGEGQQVQPGTSVNLVVAVALAPAALLAPSNGAGFAVSQGMPTVSWQAVPNAAGYRVQFESEVCAFLIIAIAPCIYSTDGKWGPPYTDYHARSFVNVTTTSATPDFQLRIHDGVPRAGHSGNVRWQVFPVDDFGTLGPPSGFFTFHKALRNPDVYGPVTG